MGKVRVRPETGALYLDFFYRGIRCREQTALQDNVENRRRVKTLMTHIDREIKQGRFDYHATFPESPRAERFASPLAGEQLAGDTRPAQAPTADLTVASAANATPSFSDFSVTWRAEMSPQWRRLHRQSVDAIFSAHLLPAFEGRSLDSITKADVLTFRAALAQLPGRRGATLSPVSINKIIGILRQCMTEASERFGLPDVCKNVKRLKARRADVQPFSLEEVGQIRAAIRSDFRNYVTVRFFTGMRTGEINGLKWCYVDFERDLILVRETFAAGASEKDAKSETSLRDIPMLPMVREALRSQWETRSAECEYVFASSQGNPVDVHNFANRIWYPLLRYLQLPKRRPYQTRHTAATLMLASGENPEWIAKLMGHSNTQMLFTVYSRFVPNLTRQDGLAITGMLSGQSLTPNPQLQVQQATREDELLTALASLSPEKLGALLRQAMPSVPLRSKE